MSAAGRVLDRVTGRLPMYRLVTVSLSAVLVVALALAAAGILFWSPLAILTTTGVAIAVTWVVSRIGGAIVGIRVHAESSVVTGLLLGFLLLPSLDLAALGVTALAAALAAASKFVLAWRGRHLVNPAAFGVLAVSVLGLGGAGWWVATPALLPVVAIGAALVLWRTRTHLVGLVFMALSLALVVPALIGFGSAPGLALLTAIGSYPIVFLGGFMLTEPMTLPPRRRQQLAVAVVVAVLFALPLYVSFSVGTFALSQEFALVAGNLLAAVLALPVGARLRYLGSRGVGSDAVEYRFAADRALKARPGQYIELDVPHARSDARGVRRHLSLTALPGEGRNELAIAVRTSPGASSFKRRLAELEPGDPVRATWLGGDFVLPDDRDAPVLLVAGGIGITPFVSDPFLGSRNAVLVHRLPSLDDVLYRDELVASGVPVILVTPDEPRPLPPGWRRADSVAEAIDAVPHRAHRIGFVSGAPAFVERATADLRARGVTRVRTDRFSGY